MVKEQRTRNEALVSFVARPKPKISFLSLSLPRNQTETLATQASIYTGKISFKAPFSALSLDQLYYSLSADAAITLWRRGGRAVNSSNFGFRTL